MNISENTDRLSMLKKIQALLLEIQGRANAEHDAAKERLGEVKKVYEVPSFWAYLKAKCILTFSINSLNNIEHIKTVNLYERRNKELYQNAQLAEAILTAQISYFDKEIPALGLKIEEIGTLIEKIGQQRTE